MAGVWTLNEMVPPMFTLVSVAKPWMDASPPPESQTDCGVPGFEFSHAMALPPAPHGSAWAAGARGTITTMALKRTMIDAMLRRFQIDLTTADVLARVRAERAATQPDSCSRAWSGGLKPT